MTAADLDLRAVRKQAGATRRQVARLIGVPTCTVGFWETGQRAVPSFLPPAWPTLCAQAARSTTTDLARGEVAPGPAEGLSGPGAHHDGRRITRRPADECGSSNAASAAGPAGAGPAVIPQQHPPCP